MSRGAPWRPIEPRFLPTGTEASWRHGRVGWLEVCVTWRGRWANRPTVSQVADHASAGTPHYPDRAVSLSVEPQDISAEAPAGHASGIWQIAITK